MKKVLLLAGVLWPALGLGQMLRMDYYHCGDATTEEFYFGDLHVGPHWAASLASLVDEKEYGSLLMKVVDKASGEVIYSRGYNTLWDEWRTTDQARKMRKSMPESVTMPMPKESVVVEIYSRDDAGAWVKKFAHDIDPGDYNIARHGARYETFDVEVNGPVATTVDIVLLPEGYAPHERERFEAAAREFVEGVFGYPPYKELRAKFNIRAVWAPSQESGVTLPGVGVWRHTATGARFWSLGIERYQMVEDVHTLHDIASEVPYELIYILSNTDKYGGGGIYNFYGISSAETTRSKAAVYAHELSHLLAGLGDEYVGNVTYGEMYPPHREPWEENLTTLADFESKQWSRMLGEGVGVYEGGGYVAKGVYRPWPNCMMNNLNTAREFCPVCTWAITRQVERLCK